MRIVGAFWVSWARRVLANASVSCAQGAHGRAQWSEGELKDMLRSARSERRGNGHGDGMMPWHGDHLVKIVLGTVVERSWLGPGG
jgi:hypothetical protein